MVPAHNLLMFALASVLLIVVPGPSVLFVIGRSIALGKRAGVLSVLGNALGMLPAVVLVAVGVGAVVASSVSAFTVLKIAGAAYLAWLGVQAIRHRQDSHAPVQHPRASDRTLLRQGFVVGITNPKTIAFFVAVLPQFVDRGAGAAGWQMLELGLVFTVLAVLCDSGWALVAGSARDWFASSPTRMEKLAGAGGAMMIGLGGVLLTTSKQ